MQLLKGIYYGIRNTDYTDLVNPINDKSIFSPIKSATSVIWNPLKKVFYDAPKTLFQRSQEKTISDGVDNSGNSKGNPGLRAIYQQKIIKPINNQAGKALDKVEEGVVEGVVIGGTAYIGYRFLPEGIKNMIPTKKIISNGGYLLGGLEICKGIWTMCTPATRRETSIKEFKEPLQEQCKGKTFYEILDNITKSDNPGITPTTRVYQVEDKIMKDDYQVEKGLWQIAKGAMYCGGNYLAKKIGLDRLGSIAWNYGGKQVTNFACQHPLVVTTIAPGTVLLVDGYRRGSKMEMVVGTIGIIAGGALFYIGS